MRIGHCFLVTLLAMSLPYAPAVAQTHHSPVKVNRCSPEQSTTTTANGFVPAYYPRGPYYWNDVYGRRYYQYPVSTTTRHNATLSIDYANATKTSMKTIDFGLVARGELVAEVRDVGEFSPGAEIKHQFGLNPNVFPLGTGLPQCVPLRIIYGDGTEWRNPHLPALAKTI